MSRKPYDELPWWCQLLYPWFGPPWYAEIEDVDVWLAEVRSHLAARVEELADELAGDDVPGEGCLAEAGRLTVARYQAEEIIRHERPPTSEDVEDDEPAAAGTRPVVVDRDHPSWAEVDAEQRARTGDPSREDGRP